MKFLVIATLAIILLASSGCSSDKSKELFETAQFEEKQNNTEHAIKLYEEIIAKYPQSPLAKQAHERLDALKAGK
jgi:outer membrane protein assembly factor BamD (BamD/ComL family)